MLTVRVVPNASKTETVGWMGDGSLKIRLAAPPVDNKANLELMRFLSKSLKLPLSSIELSGGHTSKKKLIKIPLDKETIALLLGTGKPTEQSTMF